jgi:hypothetical protein
MPSAIGRDLDTPLARGMGEKFSPIYTNRNGSKAIIFLIATQRNGKLAAL